MALNLVTRHLPSDQAGEFSELFVRLGRELLEFSGFPRVCPSLWVRNRRYALSRGEREWRVVEIEHWFAHALEFFRAR